MHHTNLKNLKKYKNIKRLKKSSSRPTHSLPRVPPTGQVACTRFLVYLARVSFKQRNTHIGYAPFIQKR